MTSFKRINTFNDTDKKYWQHLHHSLFLLYARLKEIPS